MKKSISLILGAVFLTGAILSVSHASRDTYHNYQYQKGYYANRYEPHNAQSLAVRAHTGRVFSAKQRADHFDQSDAHTVDTNVRNYRGSRFNTQLWGYNQTSLETGSVSKTFTNRQGRWQPKVAQRESVQFGSIPKVQNAGTLSTDKFVLEVPMHWTSEVSGTVVEAGSRDINIVAQVFDKECGNIGFYTCAVAFSKTLNSESKITNTSKIERAFTNTYKSIADTTAVTGTYTESFSALKDGKDVFITRYIVSGGNGHVYIIDGESSLRNGPRLVAQMKKSFNSFHIK